MMALSGLQTTLQSALYIDSSETRETQACWNDETGSFGKISGNRALTVACKTQFGNNAYMSSAGPASYTCQLPDQKIQILYKDCLPDVSQAILKAGFRTYPELDNMSEDDVRNALIVELSNKGTMTVPQLQAQPTEKLIEYLNIYLGLQRNKNNFSSIKDNINFDSAFENKETYSSKLDFYGPYFESRYTLRARSQKYARLDPLPG